MHSGKRKSQKTTEILCARKQFSFIEIEKKDRSILFTDFYLAIVRSYWNLTTNWTSLESDSLINTHSGAEHIYFYQQHGFRIRKRASAFNAYMYVRTT